MIDQNGLKIQEEIMKCSFLENFEAFSLQLYYQHNSVTGIVPLFFVLAYSANIWWLPSFYVNCEKTSKERSNETKVKVTKKEFSLK